MPKICNISIESFNSSPSNSSFCLSRSLLTRSHIPAIAFSPNRRPSFALAFVNAIGQIAEQEGHHPDISLSWGKVIVKIYTHKIKGLTESDFILAAKCDKT